jgi:hypothetical protein
MNWLRWALLLATPASVAAQSLIHEYADPASLGLNTFVGRNSGNFTMSPAGGPAHMASRNTAVGRNTLTLNERGWENTALGANALYANRNGYHNTALGYVALGSNTNGRDNVAVGHSAMYRNLTGVHNTAIGMQSLYSNSTGSHNVAIGRGALMWNTEGNWNTGVGIDSLYGVTTGFGNTGVGGETGYTDEPDHRNVTGSLNTWVGFQAGPGSADQHDGTIGIGYRAKTTKDWQAVLGSPLVTETLLFGNVGINAPNPAAALVVMGNAVNTTGVWDVYSDARLKDDVRSFEDGLEVALRLRPVSFAYNGLEGLPSGERHIGLLAQEVEEVAPYMVSINDGRDLEDVRTLSPQALPYLLINAVHDFQEQLTALQARIVELELERDQLRATLASGAGVEPTSPAVF